MTAQFNFEVVTFLFESLPVNVTTNPSVNPFRVTINREKFIEKSTCDTLVVIAISHAAIAAKLFKTDVEFFFFFL